MKLPKSSDRVMYTYHLNEEESLFLRVSMGDNLTVLNEQLTGRGSYKRILLTSGGG